MNVIFRIEEEGEIRSYQIKGNATESLGVNATDEDNKVAEFITKSNLTDITNPHNPISLGGNKLLKVHLTDRGPSGKDDSISIELVDGNSNELYYSSEWSGLATEELMLTAGNLVVHSDESKGKKPTLRVSNQEFFEIKTNANPFETKGVIWLKSSNDLDPVEIVVWDINGKIIKKEVMHIDEQFMFGDKLESGIYIITVKQGGKTKSKRMIKR